MPRISKDKLSSPTVKAATFDGRAYKLHDGDGLFLHVKQGGRYWRFRFWLGQNANGKAKERLMALGVFPSVSLKEARRKRDDARVLLDQGVDPVVHRQEKESREKVAGANTFEAVAREWWEDRHRHKAAFAERDLRRLEMYIFPHLGTDPIAKIDSLRLLNVLRRVERAGKVPTAHKVKDVCSQVFEFAILTKRAGSNPAEGLGRRALRPKDTGKHHPAAETPEQLAQLLRAIDTYGGEPTTTAALRLSALLFPRPGELRTARWEEFDLIEGTWDFNPSKGGRPLLTPLPGQALEILRELRPITGPEGFVFPAQGADKPISNATLGNALRRVIRRHSLDFDAVPHGFRATARTLLVEALNEAEEVIELQLTHTVRDRLGRAYNRTTLLEQRRAMLQRWADYLDTLRVRVVSLPTKAVG
jgi:integrase